MNSNDSIDSSSSGASSVDYIAFISDICGTLKNIKRTGWVKHNVPFPESVADHMHRCAMCVLLLRNDPTSHQQLPYDDISLLDKDKLLRMASTHDLCESIAGDITPFCANLSQKEEKEEQAMLSIQKIVGNPLGTELYHLWKEYEEQKTIEAIYCKDIDKFEMVVQAYEYEKKHLLPRHTKRSQEDEENELASTKKTIYSGGDDKNDMRVPVFKEPMRGFFISTNNVFQTSFFRKLDKELRERRKVMLQEKGWSITEDENQNYS